MAKKTKRAFQPVEHEMGEKPHKMTPAMSKRMQREAKRMKVKHNGC